MNGDEAGCWFVVSRRFIAADGLNYFASRSDCSPTRPTIVEHTTNRARGGWIKICDGPTLFDEVLIP